LIDPGQALVVLVVVETCAVHVDQKKCGVLLVE